MLLLGTGRWFYGGVHAVLLAYHARQYLRRQHLADVTEIFRQVGCSPGVLCTRSGKKAAATAPAAAAGATTALIAPVDSFVRLRV